MRSAREKAAAVQLWFPERSASVPGREQALPWVKQKAAADLRPAACRLLTAAAVRQLQAAAVRLWFPERSASVLGRE